MTKKTLIIIVILLSTGIVLGGFGIVYLITKNKTTPPPTQNNPQVVPGPDSYTLSLNEYNQNVTGELTADGKTTTLDDISKVNHYGLVSFNSASDIMWFQCAQGYEVSSFNSSTGNKAVKISPEVNIEITEITAGAHNNLTVVCSKIKQ